MHGPTCTFWANLTPFSLQYPVVPEGEGVKAATGGIFLVSLVGGTAPTRSYGLYAGSHKRVALPPPFANNATVLTYQGDRATCVNLTIPLFKAPSGARLILAITFFAANNATLALSGTFMQQAGLKQTLSAVDGARTTSAVGTGGVTVALVLGEYVRFATGSM